MRVDASRTAGVDVERPLHVGTVVIAVGGPRMFQLPLRASPTSANARQRNRLNSWREEL
jgi:hypothetical protein